MLKYLERGGISKYGASTQIVVSDYVEEYQKFMVLRRIEIPRGDFTFDNAVNKLIEIDEIYDPDYFYIDAGSGE